MADEKRDDKRKVFMTMGEPTHCSVCGGPVTYRGRGTYECDHCKNIDLDDFGRIDQYLEEHGPTSAPVISRALHIPIAKVRDLIAQGRLEPIPTGGRSLDSEAIEKAMPKEETVRRTGTFVGNGPSKENDAMRFLKKK